MGFAASSPECHRPSEQHGKREPKNTPREGFAKFHNARATVKRAQIKREKKKDAENENNPMRGRDFAHLRFTIYDLRANCKSIAIIIQIFADAEFCSVTCDAPMFGRLPLCHHSTSALAT